MIILKVSCQAENNNGERSKVKRMKILYDCFSCSPYYGSDEGIGWLWPYYMRNYHEVWALVRKDRKPDIEKYCKLHGITNINFIYCDIPDCINFYYKRKEKNKNGVIDFLAYQFLWQFAAVRKAKKVHQSVHFDLVHHVSTNDFRLLGRLYKLKVPLVLGPLGGAQETSEKLKGYIKGHEKSEIIRKWFNHFFVVFPGYKKMLRKAEKIYFSNKETQDFLMDKIRDSSKCSILTEIGMKREEIQKEIKEKKHEVFTFLWAGRMEYRKGLEFLLEVLDQLPMEEKWQLILCGTGSEMEKYQRICETKNYKSRVKFLGAVPYEKMKTIYEEADVFAFPSLRETTGTVILEAMAQGVPVICFDQGGASSIITKETGFLISGGSQEEYLRNFSQAMKQCISNPKMVFEKGQYCIERVEKYYTWEQKVCEMENVYRDIIKT